MMVTDLADLLEDFPGPETQTRCFTHVLNLLVKSIIRQFDLLNSKGGRNQMFDEAAKELLSLPGNIDVEEDEASHIGALQCADCFHSWKHTLCPSGSDSWNSGNLGISLATSRAIFGHFFGPTRSLIWPLGPFPDLLGHICGHQAIFRAHHWHISSPFRACPSCPWPISGIFLDIGAHFGHIHVCQGTFQTCPWHISGTSLDVRAHYGHVHGQFRAHTLILGHISGMSLAYFRHIYGN